MLMLSIRQTRTHVFFGVILHDEQAPQIVKRFPGDGDFAISRFSAIETEVVDYTDIDQASGFVRRRRSWLRHA